jgi:hypothetical protein
MPLTEPASPHRASRAQAATPHSRYPSSKATDAAFLTSVLASSSLPAPPLLLRAHPPRPAPPRIYSTPARLNVTVPYVCTALDSPSLRPLACTAPFFLLPRPFLLIAARCLDSDKSTR